MPSNAQHHFHLPAQEWELQQQEFTFVRQRLDSTTLGVFSNLKDSMVLIPNSWKCFKSTNVFENIQVFQLGSTKSPGLDSLGVEFLGSAPHLGIPCPTAAPAQLQTSRLAQPGFICCAWEQRRSTSKKTCNSSRETFLLSL